MTVLIVATLRMTDADSYARYAEAFPAVFARHSGTIVVADAEPVPLDGGAVDKIVIMSFPDQAAAVRFLKDPEYQAVSEDRRRGATVDAWLVKGYA